MTARRVSAAAVGICVLATLVACSSGHKGTGSASGGQTAAGAPIVIGTVGSYSGPLASSQAPTKAVIQAWAQWVNAKGGIAGHPVKLVLKDDANDPAKGLTAVKQLVEQDKVIAIVSDQTNTDNAWASYVSSKGIPVIGGAPINAAFSTNPDFFVSGENFAAMNYRVLALAKKNGPRMGLLYCAEAPGCAQLKPIQEAMAKAVGGVSVVVAEKISASASDYTAQCQALKDAGVGSYYVGSGSETVIRVVQACRAQGLTAPLVAADGPITNKWTTVSAMDGMVGTELTYPWFDSSTPAAKEFHDAVAKYAPALGEKVGSDAMHAWVAAKLFEKAVENVGGAAITSKSLLQGLYNMKSETLGGLIGPITFTQGKPGRINCGFDLTLRGGKFDLVNGATVSCAPDAVVNALYDGLAAK